ncbi:MAG: VWA domain-containing protein [Verrucomicrobiae bacterium]|nr:VWA domain-containing protein [Verrucomicrobiae bacterium]
MHPLLALLAVAALPLAIGALARLERRRRAALAQFASDRLLVRLAASVSPKRRRVKRTLLAAGIAALLLAAARPQWGWREEEVRRRGMDLIFAVDTSKSMLAQDVRPNRLARAKLAVLDLADRLEGDRVGLIAFAGTAFLQCPLTLDHDAFRVSLDALDANVIPKGGTNLGAAIREARAALEAGGTGQKALLLLTDGEDLERDALSAARDAAKAGLRVFTVGVGTAAGEIIPVPADAAGATAGEYVKDPEGRVVKSRLDAKTLGEIAAITGGLYQPLGLQGEGLRAIYEEGLASFSRTQLLSRLNRFPIERFPWFLGFGLLLFAAEWLIGDRRRPCGSPTPAPNARALGAALLAAAAFVAPRAQAALWSAENAWREGRFQDALAEYQKAAKRDPQTPEVQFNLGAASYRTGNFSEAAGAFFRAAKHAKNPDLPPKAFYNLGNALYRTGQGVEKTKPEDALKAWEKAVESYDQSLKLKADDADAKFNRDFVRRKIEELKKKQLQPPPPSQQKKDPSKNDQKNQQQPPASLQQDKGAPQENQQPPESPGPEKESSSPDSPQRKAPPPELKPQGESPSSNAGAKPPPPPSSGKASGKEKGRDEHNQGEPAAAPPGQMSPEEAKALLDALKGDERKMPLTVDRMGRGPVQDEPPKRDW